MVGKTSVLDHMDLTGSSEHVEGLDDLPEDFNVGFEKLKRLAEKKIFQKDQIIEKQGDPCEHCYLILKGQVVGYDFTEFGAEHDYFQNEKGSTLLETQVLLNMVSPMYFRAVEQSELASVERGTLLSAMKNDSDIAMYITGNLMIKFNWTMHRLSRATRCAMYQLCDSLLTLAGKYGKNYDNKVMITQKISQQALSNQLHVNRTTVIRNLNELKDRNLIEQINGLYCIRDIDALKRFMMNK